jgi:hypothetical protein
MHSYQPTTHDEIDGRFTGISPFTRYPRDNPEAVYRKALQPIVICTVGLQIALVLGMGASVAGVVWLAARS